MTIWSVETIHKFFFGDEINEKFSEVFDEAFARPEFNQVDEPKEHLHVPPKQEENPSSSTATADSSLSISPVSNACP